LRRAGCRLRSGNVMNYGSLNKQAGAQYVSDFE
jgi:hypothetical protein